jgi:hypothetical protein
MLRQIQQQIDLMESIRLVGSLQLIGVLNRLLDEFKESLRIVGVGFLDLVYSVVDVVVL